MAASAAAALALVLQSKTPFLRTPDLCALEATCAAGGLLPPMPWVRVAQQEFGVEAPTPQAARSACLQRWKDHGDAARAVRLLWASHFAVSCQVLLVYGGILAGRVGHPWWGAACLTLCLLYELAVLRHWTRVLFQGGCTSWTARRLARRGVLAPYCLTAPWWPLHDRALMHQLCYGLVFLLVAVWWWPPAGLAGLAGLALVSSALDGTMGGNGWGGLRHQRRRAAHAPNDYEKRMASAAAAAQLGFVIVSAGTEEVVLLTYAALSATLSLTRGVDQPRVALCVFVFMVGVEVPAQWCGGGGVPLAALVCAAGIRQLDEVRVQWTAAARRRLLWHHQ